MGFTGTTVLKDENGLAGVTAVAAPGRRGGRLTFGTGAS